MIVMELVMKYIPQTIVNSTDLIHHHDHLATYIEYIPGIMFGVRSTTSFTVILHGPVYPQ